MNHIVIKIPELDCPSEEKLLRKALKDIPGVTSLACDFIQGELTVTYNDPDPSILLEAIRKTGLNATLKTSSTTQPVLPSNKNEWLWLMMSGVLAITAEILSYSAGSEHRPIVLLFSFASIALGGKVTLKKGLLALKTFTLNINFLMMIAIIGAFFIGEWPESAMVTVLFGVAECIERYSLDKARHAIQSLMAISPETARVKREKKWFLVPLQNIQVGEIIWVKPGERIPLDGIITMGESSVNQAPLTGESLSVDKKRGDEVFAGTLNEHGSFEFNVIATQNNTTLAKIIQMVMDAQQQRAPTQRFVDKFSAYYTPSMVGLALLLAILPPLFFGLSWMIWLYKALVLLVIACPCALVISTPVTIVSGLTAAAKQGILIKGGTYLEQGYQLNALAFDKTGTLTEGKPSLIDVVTLNATWNEEKLLQYAASLDVHSNHPIAKAIVDAHQRNSSLDLLPVQQFSTILGRGVKALINNQFYFIGNHSFAEDHKICHQSVESLLNQLEQEGKTTLVLGNEKEVFGVFAVADKVRETSKKALTTLQQMGIKTIMITGDNERTARSIAATLNIDKVYANQLPQDKFHVIEQLLKVNTHVGMIGDGMNDAPALAKASIGFAMGAAGNDTALETADVALMEDNLEKVATFINISQMSHRHLVQNISFALAVKGIFFVLALLGEATLWMAVFADMGASLIVVANGLKILKKTSL